MLERLRLATVLATGLLACGDDRDATQLLAASTEGQPQSSVGAEQPAPGTSGEQAPAGESGDGVPTPQREPESTAGLDCEPGTGRCNGARAEKCSPDGVWLFVEECAQCNGFSYCSADPQVGAHCLTPACCFPEMRCTGAVLQQCNQTATGFETIATCASAALCEVGLGEARCVNGCSPGETRCTGAQLERCNEDLTGYDLVEQCSASCDARCRADAGADAAGG